jgi:type IV pilus assembly PilO-like protein
VKRKLSPRALYAVVIGGVLVYALAFWFVAVSPKRAEASALKDEVAALQVTVASARLAAMPQKNDDAQPVEVADIFRLAKAMPSGPDMPGILLELSRIAEETGIEFQSVTPAASEVVGGCQKVPISLAFDGNFYELSDFLFRLRTLVGVRGGELRAAGRLFAVESISFAESTKGFPELGATLSVVAYVYGTDAPATAVTPPAATTPPADPNAAAPAADPNAATPAPAPAAAPTGAEASP